MSELVCTCHCGGSMFYRHLHADSCVLSREGEEAPQTDEQATIATLTQQLAHANEQLRLYRASADDACGLWQQVAQLTAELDAHIETNKKLFSQMVGMKTELNDAQVDLTRWQAQYHELIMAVGKKYPGETRHQTALRYIKQAENKSELRSALELCVARLEGLKEDGISQAEQQALDAANTALDAQRALDVEREKVRELEKMYRFSITERNKLNAETDELAIEIYSRDSQLATLQAQLRQVEGERDILRRQVDNQVRTIKRYQASQDELTTLRQLVEALPVCNPTSFQIFEAADGNGYDVHGAIKEPYSVGWIGTFLHKAEAESYIQALTARATLAAKDAGKVSTSIIGKQVPPSQWDKNAGVSGDVS